jgi:hypothetical protein
MLEMLLRVGVSKLGASLAGGVLIFHHPSERARATASWGLLFHFLAIHLLHY